MRATPKEKEAADRDCVLGDAHGLLGVTIQAPSDNASATVTVTSDSILEPSIYVATLPKQGVRYKVYPPIKYKYNALVRNKQTIPVTVTYRVELPDKKTSDHNCYRDNPTYVVPANLPDASRAPKTSHFPPIARRTCLT